jgi:hypothetical protein
MNIGPIDLIEVSTERGSQADLIRPVVCDRWVRIQMKLDAAEITVNS